MVIKAYIDNSVISELCKMDSKNEKNRKLIFEIFNKYHIEATNCIVTDKLFLEFIYMGNIRKNIVNTHKDEIAAILNGLCLEYVSEDGIKNSIDNLEVFFQKEMMAALSIEVIKNKMLKKIENNPIDGRFKIFDKKIIDYSNDIVNNLVKYDQFIENLVRDSVIRYALLAIANKINEITFTKILNSLLLKYTGMTKDYLLAYVAAAKLKTDTNNKRKDQKRLIRLKDDLADIEPQQLVFYGKNINGKNYPITFITKEPLETIKNRMIYYFDAGIVEIAKINSNQSILLLGRTLIIDFDKSDVEEIDSGIFMNTRITKSSYTITNL